MKYSIIALSMVAVLGLSACASGGTWTPMSAGRTAGKGTVEMTKPAPMHKADKTFSKALRK
ncbi:MAG: hypothetical protein GC185_10040 [Alphaproteobacteria bacterium]|nr:hypothetical protein [Alphaproteobacteria bacterium]